METSVKRAYYHIFAQYVKEMNWNCIVELGLSLSLPQGILEKRLLRSAV